jgi:SulP family sulfate permease
MGAVARVSSGERALILDLAQVPAMDVTGLVAFQSALAKLNQAGVFVVITGAQAQPMHTMAKAGIVDSPAKIAFAPDAAQALARIRRDIPGIGSSTRINLVETTRIGSQRSRRLDDPDTGTGDGN